MLDQGKTLSARHAGRYGAFRAATRYHLRACRQRLCPNIVASLEYIYINRLEFLREAPLVTILSY